MTSAPGRTARARPDRVARALAGLFMLCGASLGGVLAFSATHQWPPPWEVVAGFVAVGLLGGFLAAAVATSDPRLAGWLRALVGMVGGAAAGLLTYSAGYVASTYPVLPDRAAYLLYFAEAVYAFTFTEFFAVILGGTVGLGVARYAWRFQGVVAYFALVSVVAGYAAFTLFVTMPLVPPGSWPVSVLLFGAELASLSMVVLYSFYNYDVAMKKRWHRHSDDAKAVPFSRHYLPRVAMQVAVFNEPPGLVIDTLRSLEAMDYPPELRLIMVLDDSTDPALSGPVEAYCRQRGLWYQHRTDRKGYKAGALNEALAETPEDVELIAVIDADYQVTPEYLRETVGFFINPALAFVQTPQDYRNGDQSFLAAQYVCADAYFYRAVLPSRNEANTIIFCGTMGILRRSALEEVGGWGEAFLTEDSELSARIHLSRWETLYVNRTYGHGLVPATFDAYKKQHHRWAFGGVQILKAHLLRVLTSRLSLRHKLDFFVGGIHWFDGVSIVIIALLLAALSIGDVLGLPVVTHHAREVWMIGLVPLFLLVDGVSRLHLALRRNLDTGPWSTLGVLGMWFAIKFSNTGAALKSLAGTKQAFVRTPKGPEGRVGWAEALVRAFRLTRFETAMTAILGTAAVVATVAMALDGDASPSERLTRLLLVVWTTYHAMVFACGPLYAYKSFTTFVPEDEAGGHASRLHAAGQPPAGAPPGHGARTGAQPAPATQVPRATAAARGNGAGAATATAAPASRPPPVPARGPTAHGAAARNGAPTTRVVRATAARGAATGSTAAGAAVRVPPKGAAAAGPAASGKKTPAREPGS